MSLYSNPQPYDILVSLLIGIAAGGLTASLIFIFYFKKRWEKKWEYYNRIKSISKIRLPQLSLDDASLSKTSLQNSVIDNSSISDKRFLERVLAEDHLDSNESLFLTPSVFEQMSGNGKHNVRGQKKNTDKKLGNPIYFSKSESQFKDTEFYLSSIASSGSTLLGNSNEILQEDSRKISEDDVPLGIKLYTFK